MREDLTADKTYTIGTDFPDPASCWNWCRDNLDLRGFNVKVLLPNDLVTDTIMLSGCPVLHRRFV